MLKFFFAVLCLGTAICTASASTARYSIILGGKERNIEEGYIYGNKYCQVAFLNPTLHGGAVTVGDFNIMTRRDIAGKPTLDDDEARHRIFFKPEVQVRSTGRRSRAIYAQAGWSLDKIPNGVRYKRTFSNGANELAAIIDMTFDPVKAQFFCKAVLKNDGRSDLSVDFLPEFTFLRTTGEPLEFMLQRFYGRYVDGKRIVIEGMEKTLLTGQVQSYWWRKIVGDDSAFSGASFVRETIPFTHKRLLPPRLFGLVNLPGRGVLIWDMGKDQANKPSSVKINWESANGSITPEWGVKLSPGQEKTVEFRILTLRGLHRFDIVDNDWVFCLDSSADLCEIQSQPLVPKDKLSIAATVENMLSKQIMINQRSELAAMTPFSPSRVEWRAATMFQSYIVYPVKITIATFGGKKQLEISGNIIH